MAFLLARYHSPINCALLVHCRWIHTQSICLTLLGLIHIFASFPIAFFIYYFIFQIEPFYTLNFLSVYVILAIGADDIFVMVDAWKQFAHHPPHKRMQLAFSRASKVRHSLTQISQQLFTICVVCIKFMTCCLLKQNLFRLC